MDKEQRPKKKYRFGWIAFVVLLVLAIILDIIGLIPITKTFGGTLFWLIANLYFKFVGIKVLDAKKLGTMLASWITGAIPFLQELPIELTAGIVVIFLIIRFEDKHGVNIMGKMNLLSTKGGKLDVEGKKMLSQLNIKGTRGPEAKRVPKYNNGRREPNNDVSLLTEETA